ncbi:hypothetical protein BBB39_13200 [Bordetella trematum]|uniref:Uncharacterized protein n=1 Tax=Bordetella trematum TaxID=123899 RepID=A0A157SU39_9BORD|nr:hypothetical protein [Bordetella trematum]AZR94628.1 hypothetical protein BBB39_13200 [Bordetella trematum]NNH19095.1 hypothetical protein [Bordetella trematum]SAI01052.1 Uncharacterised protein [Bordetella trematum]SAI73957.1 Uncharacterised protein [Bordetella trematum]SUV97125.1 Uncharacterised protein [Bordetella trematum]
MGIKTTTTTVYECDVCRSEVPELSIFGVHKDTLWSDRDVTATLTLSMRLDISYVTDRGVICNACAAKHLRAVADAIDFVAQQHKGEA